MKRPIDRLAAAVAAAAARDRRIAEELLSSLLSPPAPGERAAGAAESRRVGGNRPRWHPPWGAAGILALCCWLLATSAAGQEPPAVEETAPVVGAAWCVLRPAGDGEAAPGCDVGAGVSLQRWHRLSWVAVVGMETLGSGLAWVALRPERGPVVAVAVGAVVRYGEAGIEREVYPALGCTLAFGGRRGGGG